MADKNQFWPNNSDNKTTSDDSFFWDNDPANITPPALQTPLKRQSSDALLTPPHEATFEDEDQAYFDGFLTASSSNHTPFLNAQASDTKIDKDDVAQSFPKIRRQLFGTASKDATNNTHTPLSSAAETTSTQKRSLLDGSLFGPARHVPASPMRMRLMPFNQIARSMVGSSVNSNSRFLTDFEQLGKLGEGEFGQVFKCRHRIDGCLYAVKRYKKSRGHGTGR